MSTNTPFYQVVVQVLDYNPQTWKERVTFYQSDRNAWQAAKSWTIEDDLVDFPLETRSQHVTIRYTVRGTRSGRLALVVMSSKIYLSYCPQYHQRKINLFNEYLFDGKLFIAVFLLPEVQ